jgi:hypothetical protein
MKSSQFDADRAAVGVEIGDQTHNVSWTGALGEQFPHSWAQMAAPGRVHKALTGRFS